MIKLKLNKNRVFEVVAATIACAGLVVSMSAFISHRFERANDNNLKNKSTRTEQLSFNNKNSITIPVKTDENGGNWNIYLQNKKRIFFGCDRFKLSYTVGTSNKRYYPLRNEIIFNSKDEIKTIKISNVKPNTKYYISIEKTNKFNKASLLFMDAERK